MVYILLIPFDVFATVRHHATLFEFTDPILHHQFNIKIYDLYFTCYIGMICLCFIGLPFSYFYAQSVQEEEEMILEATLEQEVRAQASQAETSAPGGATPTPSRHERAYTLKGMDSSESQSDDEETPHNIGSQAASADQPQAQQDEFGQDTDPAFGFGQSSQKQRAGSDMK